MLTCYDAMTAQLFDEAGIETLLVGDSLGNVVLGHKSTIPVTMEEIIVFTSAVVRGTQRALVVADLPFGSYEISVAQAVESGIRLTKESGAAAVKLEGGAEFAPHVKALVDAGVAVCGHIGFTPQSENILGGFRVQGREDDAATAMIADAKALQDAGAFAIVIEMVPADIAAEVQKAIDIPIIGIGAGNGTAGQVLVWQDMLGLGTGRVPRFVKKYADLATTITDAASQYRADVKSGAFPAEEHTF